MIKDIVKKYLIEGKQGDMNYLIIKDTDWPGEDRHTIEFWTGSKWTEMQHKAKSYTGDEARVESRKLEKYEDKYTLVTYMMAGFA